MRDFRTLHEPAHLEIQPVADKHKRDVVERVRIAFAKLIGPDQKRVVEQAAVAARLGSFGQALDKVGELPAVPAIDAR